VSATGASVPSPTSTTCWASGATNPKGGWTGPRGGEQRGAPGLVRISLGAYNDMADINRAVRALEWLAAGDVQGTYRVTGDGSFIPEGYEEPLLFDIRHEPLPASASMASV
jgi:hypothetical protein